MNRKKGRKLRRGRNVQSGGMIYGPTHEEGGIPMRINTTGEVLEVEGREYLINAKAAQALGLEFLDKLNATANDYWPSIQGFNQGELTHLGSNYRNGGQIGRNNMRRRKMAGGTFTRGTTPYKHNLHNYHTHGRTPYGHGGRMGSRNNCGPGMHWMPPSNGRAGYCMQGSTHPNGGYARGGRMGMNGGNRVTSHPNMQCPPMQCYQQNKDGTWGCGWCYTYTPPRDGGNYRRGGRPTRRMPHGGSVAPTYSPCSGLDGSGRNCTH